MDNLRIVIIKKENIFLARYQGLSSKFKHSMLTTKFLIILNQ